MPSTISASYNSTLRITETFTGPLVDPSNNTSGFFGPNAAGTLTATSTVPATKHAEGSKALSSGTATIDLTDLLDAEGNAQTFDGLKVQIAMFSNPATNANPITITFGNATPYLLLGTGWKIILLPGQSTGPILLNDASPTVSSSLKNIDLAGTLIETLNYAFVAG